jgi:uracil-DNA glycosylase
MRNRIAALKEACYACRECPLGCRFVDGLDPHVFATGCARRGVVFFIGEAPGGTEVVMKRPLVGKAGAFYEKSILGAAGIDRVAFGRRMLCCAARMRATGRLFRQKLNCAVHTWMPRYASLNQGFLLPWAMFRCMEFVICLA